MSDVLRHLPQVQSLLETDQARHLTSTFSRDEVVAAIRGTLQDVRARLLKDPGAGLPDFAAPAFFEDLSVRIRAARRSTLCKVVNGTGVIIHTNLGRAPLAQEAFAAMERAASGYANLELDLGTGKRGSRYKLVENLLCTLTGAEAAIVVNNCAAAVLVCLSALARDGEVVASRGELIEIGGSFRMPDVILQSGAHLREVGATNKTSLADYEQAIGEGTRVLLKSHTSNFRIVGFTAAPGRRDLADLARRHGVVLMEDLGSGVLVDLAPHGLTDEPVVGDILRTGVDVVTFSGDKLLGGPQSGIIAGRKTVIDRLKTHPLLRAVRIDKLSLAALEATLRLYRPPHDPFEKIPVLRCLAQTMQTVQARAMALAREVCAQTAFDAQVVESVAYAGGGSLPQQDLESFAVVLTGAGLTPDALATALRQTDPPVIGRIADGRFLLDMRAVSDGDIPLIVSALKGLNP